MRCARGRQRVKTTGILLKCVLFGWICRHHVVKHLVPVQMTV